MSSLHIHRLYQALALSTLLTLPLASRAQEVTGQSGTNKPTSHSDDHSAFRISSPADTHTIYLRNVTQQSDANELLVAVRNLVDPTVKIFLDSTQNAIVIGGPPEQIAIAEKLVQELDRPHKSYRLTFTIAESDGGKRLGVEHFSIIAVAGQHTTLKQGDKVPVATGSFSTENAASQTQFTYLDVGMNFDVTVTDVAGGVYLTSKVEQSAVGPSNTIAGVQEPVVRQTVLQGASFVTLNKPLMLGSIDVPASTRHFDIDVAVEPLK